MKISILFLSLLLSVSALASTSECELNYNYTNTGSNMTFALHNSSIESIEELGAGTLGAFFLNNQESLVCAGSSSINGIETAFPIMGDDLTTAVIDGYLTNQELYLIFTNEYGTQYKLTPSPCEGFEINGIYYVDSFLYEMIECGNEIYGCMDTEANNYNSFANIEDNSCIFDIAGCTDIGSCNFNEDASTDDGSCIYISSPSSYNVPVSPANWGGELEDTNNATIVLIDESNNLGCHTLDFTFDGAIALIKRGECQFSQKALNAQNAGAAAVIIYNSSPGNFSMGAGNYANQVHIPVYSMDGSYGAELASFLVSNNEYYTSNLQEHTLTIITTSYDCDGNCANDEDDDGICDEQEIEGCTDSESCNFNPEASNNSNCLYPEEGYNCSGNCNVDSDNDGICDNDEDEEEGCLSLSYDYSNTGTNMTFALPNSSIQSIEELGAGTLGAFFLDNEENLICAGSSNIDGLETAFPIMGDDLTTEYKDGYLVNEELNLIFTTESGTEYILTPSPNEGYEINGIYYVDSFSYELFECGNEIYGCLDSEANNYNSSANLEDNSCTYDVYGCLDSEANNYNSSANLEDNSCTYESLNCGCLNPNYTEYYTQGYLAECDNGSCAIPVQSNGITNENFNTPLNTGSNSIIGFNLMNIYIPEGSVVGAFYDLNNDGQIGGNASLNSMDKIYFECVGLSNYENSFFTLAIWGDDSFSNELDGVPQGAENVLLALLLPDQTVVSFDISPETFVFTVNGLIAVNTINFEVVVNGCTNPESCNYNNNAELDDGSCLGYYGCMQEMYVDYNSEASCHNQELCEDTWQDNLLDMEEVYEGVLTSMDSAIAANQDLSSALDNQTIINLSIENEMSDVVLSIELANENIADLVSQLLEAEANNDNLQIINDELEQANSILNSLLEDANNSVITMENELEGMLLGMESMQDLMDISEENSAELSNIVSDMTGQMETANLTIIEMSTSMETLSANNLEIQLGMASLESTNIEMSSMMDTLMIENQTLMAPIDIDLISGWNIIGYTLRVAQDAVISFDNIIENISVVKNNSGDVYWPEFGFNGIGDLLPGQGYQLLTFNDHNGFNFEDMDGLSRTIYPTVPQWAIDMETAVHPNDVRKLVRIVNTLGQEVIPENEFKGNVLYYLFNDGSVEKKLN